MDLAARISDVLRTSPGLSAREIMPKLAETGTKVDKSTINSALYSHRDLFRHDASVPPYWYVIGSVSPQAPPVVLPPPIAPPRPGGNWAATLGLYPWQTRALDGWAKNGYRGTVEAVTGAGKTRLALAAIEAEIRRGGRAVAIVPTRDLQDQWIREISLRLLETLGVQAQVGAMGGGSFDTLANCHILVATVQSACQYNLGLSRAPGLLVADEVHHYGAQVWSAALEPNFDRRLGLTATYEREDHGVEYFLDPYFGSYRYSLGYEEALEDNVIAPFKIAFIGVAFTDEEASLYEEADEKARRRRGTLINQFGLTPEPFGVFMRQVQQLAKSQGEGSLQAGMYLSAFTKRRKIMAAAAGKFEYLAKLVPAIKAADSTILFSQTREAADRAVSVVGRFGVTGESLHAELDPSERQETFDAFRDGTNRFIAAPRLLDEGVDVPDADLAIVLASSRSRRQMIQRMGRVIRKKPDGRHGRVAILYVEGTSEDPTTGAHEDFVQFVVDAASEVTVFDRTSRPADVVTFLNNWA